MSTAPSSTLAPPRTRPNLFRSASSSSSINSVNSTCKTSSRDKPRLYLALYPRGGSSKSPSYRHNANCDSYHWSLIVAPQTSSREDPGTRFHIAHNQTNLEGATDLHGQPFRQWFYEEQDLQVDPVANQVLIRVTVCKVKDEERLRNILRNTPIRENDPSFNCLTWVRDAFCAATADGKCLKSYVGEEDWSAIEACTRKYCKRKREDRRFLDPSGPWDMNKISTFNYWENREITI